MRSLAIREKVLGPEHPDTATSLDHLGMSYAPEDDMPLIRRSLAIREKILGSGHPDTATSLYNLGNRLILYYNDDGGELERSLAIREQVLGPEHPDTATSLGSLGVLRTLQGQYNESLPLLKRSLAIREKSLGPNHPVTASGLYELADYYSQQHGNEKEAERLLRKALGIQKEILGTKHTDTSTTLHALGELLTDQGRYTEAKRLTNLQVSPIGETSNAAWNQLSKPISTQERMFDEAHYLQLRGDRDGIARRQSLLDKLWRHGFRDPDFSSELYSLTSDMTNLGMCAGAERYLRKYIALTGRSDLGLRLAALRACQGDEVTSQHTLDEAMLNPNIMKGWDNVCESGSIDEMVSYFIAEGNYDRAISLGHFRVNCNKLYGINVPFDGPQPDHRDAFYSLATSYGLANRWQEAVKYLEVVLKAAEDKARNEMISPVTVISITRELRSACNNIGNKAAAQDMLEREKTIRNSALKSNSYSEDLSAYYYRDGEFSLSRLFAEHSVLSALASEKAREAGEDASIDLSRKGSHGGSAKIFLALDNGLFLGLNRVVHDPRQASKLSKSRYSNTFFSYFFPLSNLAKLYADTGEPELAIALYERLQHQLSSFTRAALDGSHLVGAADISYNLGRAYEEMGDLDSALKMYNDALGIIERPGFRANVDSFYQLDVTLFGRLALAEAARGNFSKSRHWLAKLDPFRILSYYQSGASIQAGNNIRILYAYHMYVIGLVYKGLGEPKSAELFLSASRDYYRTIYKGSDASNRYLLDVLMQLGNLYLASDRPGESVKAYEMAHKLNLATYGPSSSEALNSLSALIDALVMSGKHEQAYSSLAMLQEHIMDSMANQLFLLSPSARLSIRNRLDNSLRRIYSISALYPPSRSLALRARLNLQGMLAEIERRQGLLARATGPQRELADEVRGLNQRIASFALSQALRRTLERERDSKAANLYSQLPELRIQPVSTEQVADALKDVAPDGMLVEFQRYRPYRGIGKMADLWGKDRYMAMLLGPDGSIATVFLKEDADMVDRAVDKALEVTDRKNEDPRPYWQKVSQLVLEPLQPHLGGIGQLFISPDGALHRVPFSALTAVQEPQRLLSEVVKLRIITTGRDLVRLQTSSKAGSAPIVMANPDYDNAADTPRVASSSAAITSAPGNGPQHCPDEFRPGLHWCPLPQTGAEAKRVAQLLDAGAPIEGSQATAVRALQQKAPRIFHIATHGFFFPFALPKARRGLGTPVLDAGQSSSALPAVAAEDDPLLRSGLVLAGANRPGQNPADDGYLTAAEVTGMDLEGTELVTLSACETGLGDVSSGEGVYGLQRALAVAGARSTLLSLWKVDDDLTALFMEEYYMRLKAGEGRADALRHTQAWFRTSKSSALRDVRIWGAFQLSGEWRPLRWW